MSSLNSKLSSKKQTQPRLPTPYLRPSEMGNKQPSAKPTKPATLLSPANILKIAITQLTYPFSLVNKKTKSTKNRLLDHNQSRLNRLLHLIMTVSMLIIVVITFYIFQTKISRQIQSQTQSYPHQQPRRMCRRRIPSKCGAADDIQLLILHSDG